MGSGVRVLEPPFRATGKQLELARAWHEPGSRVVLMGGAIRSGKTQAAGRLFVETALERPSVYLVARSSYRSLADTTQKALLHGDGALPPLIPPEAVEQWRVTDNVVRLRNGAEILFRSLEEAHVGKLLNLTLGGVFIDQVEELDGGEAGERVFDTLLGRLSDRRGPRKLLAVANPGPLTHWVYRRLVDGRSRDRKARYVHVSMRDNAANLPADYVAEMEATRVTRPHWYRSFVLGEWGAFEGAAYEEFTEATHVVAPFEIPQAWERFESMDHGAASPTAWLAWAVDHDGNHVVFDEYYAAGRTVAQHASEILRRRAPRRDEEEPVRGNWWQAQHPGGEWEPSPAYADPSIKAKQGLTRGWGEPASVWTEYLDNDVYLIPGNNDRAAGHTRLLSLIHVEAGRLSPAWAPGCRQAGGAPRLFVFSHCEQLIAQLKSAPVAAEGLDAGNAVDGKWESRQGHAHAGCRYGAMSRPAPSPEPDPREVEPEDPRAAFLWRADRRDEDAARSRKLIHV